MRNWKTSIPAIGTLLALAGKLLQGNPLDADDYAIAMAAVGLLFAKDFNVSHTQSK